MVTIFIFKLATEVGINLGTRNMPSLVQRSIGMTTHLKAGGSTAGMFTKYGSGNEQFEQLPVTYRCKTGNWVSVLC